MAFDESLSDAVSQVRFELGDVGREQLSDDLIEGVLLSVDNHVLKAAEKLAWHLYARYSHEVTRIDRGPSNFAAHQSLSDKASAWRRVHSDLRARASRGSAAPVAIGTAADNAIARTSASVVRPIFEVGMFDNPSATQPDEYSDG